MNITQLAVRTRLGRTASTLFVDSSAMRIEPHFHPTGSDEQLADDWNARIKPARSWNKALVGLALLGLALLATFYLRNARDATAQHPPADAPVPANLSLQKRAPTSALQAPPADVLPGQRVERVAKCFSSTGSVTYSDTQCGKDARASSVELRPDSNLAQGMSVEARQASNSSSALAAQQLSAHERRVATNVTQANSLCVQLDASITAIDAAARLPQSASEQDRLREQRRQARDRQFALRCA